MNSNPGTENENRIFFVGRGCVFNLTMASPMNEQLEYRTLHGTVNYYDNQMSIGTASEKCWAAMSGGHNYDPISHQPARFLRHLRSQISAESTSCPLLPPKL